MPVIYSASFQARLLFCSAQIHSCNGGKTRPEKTVTGSILANSFVFSSACVAILYHQNMFAQYINTCPLVVDYGIAYADIDVNIVAGAPSPVSVAWKGQNQLPTLVIFLAVID